MRKVSARLFLAMAKQQDGKFEKLELNIRKLRFLRSSQSGTYGEWQECKPSEREFGVAALLKFMSEQVQTFP